MSLEKVTVPNTSNQQPLSPQDIVDAQTVLDILRKDGYTGTAKDLKDLIDALDLQKIIDGGNTYGNATQTWTFNNDEIKFRDTVNDTGFILGNNAFKITDSSGLLKAFYALAGVRFKDFVSNFQSSIFSNGLTADRDFQLPDKSGTFALLSDIITSWADLTNKPIQAETNLSLTGAVSIDITAKQSYIYNLTGNVGLTIDASNVANNESYVTEMRATTGTGVETLTLQNATDTKDVYGTFDPAVVNKLVISATKDGSGNVYISYFINQPN